MFVAVLYTSEVDREMRYTDEGTRVAVARLIWADARTLQGETTELCKWTVDLGTLPTFQNAPPNQGFYTGAYHVGLTKWRIGLLKLCTQSLSSDWNWTVQVSGQTLEAKRGSRLDR